MSDIPAIYETLRKSEMNAWVGGADPQRAGEICFDILARHIPIGFDTRLLDFGCGIGRVILTVLQHRPLLRGLTGMDIIPEVVRFCDRVIADPFPHVNFELLAETNAHYERFKDGTTAKSRDQLTATYGEAFDGAYAFSVFTHIDVDDFVSVLRFVGTMLKPGGRFLFTAFILTPYARAMLAAGEAASQFTDPAFIEDGAVFIGDRSDKLAFIAYDISRIEAMIWAAGLIPCAIEYGEWRGGGLSLSLQDVIVCRKPLA